jgi:hypothetical protein
MHHTAARAAAGMPVFSMSPVNSCSHVVLTSAFRLADTSPCRPQPTAAAVYSSSSGAAAESDMPLCNPLISAATLTVDIRLSPAFSDRNVLASILRERANSGVQ